LVSAGTDDTESRTASRVRFKRWARRAALVSVLLAVGAVLVAGAVWSYRAPILEWAIKSRLESTGATAALSVAVFDTHRLAIHGIRIGAPVNATIKSLELEYDLDTFIGGRITAIHAAGLRVEHTGFRAAIERIVGSGEFAFGLFGLNQLQANLDMLRATMAGETIHPSRLNLDYRDDTITLETTVPGPRGFVVVLGQGSLAEDAPPFRINLSGRLDPAFFPFLTQNDVSDDAVAFKLNARVGDLLAGIDAIQRGERILPDNFSADGELELDLGRVSVAGYSIGAPGRDRVRFRFDEMRTRKSVTRGDAVFDIEIGSRDTPDFAFERMNILLKTGLVLAPGKLMLAFKPDAEIRVTDLRQPRAFHLEGETTLRFDGADNRVNLDLKNGTARHRLKGRLSRKDGELTLQSEGDLSAPEDPVVFTVKGKIDAAPVLAMLSDIRAKSASAEIFLAGQAIALLPPSARSQKPAGTAGGSVRFDGAMTLRLDGAAFPGMTKTDSTTDSVTLNLKGFEAGRDWQRGRFTMSAALAPRRLGVTEIKQTSLSLEGQMRGSRRGYKFRFEPGGALQLSGIRSPSLAVPDTVRFQLAGQKNMVEADERFLPVASNLRFAHLEARGALIGRKGYREPFQLSLPSLTSVQGKKGHNLQSKGGTFTFPRLGIAARNVSVAAIAGMDGVSATLNASNVRHRARRPLLSPVSISARASLRKSKAKVTVLARQLRTPLAAKATIEHDFDRNSGRMRFTAPRFMLETRKYRFGDMFPIAVGWFDTIRGAAAVDSEVLWDRDLLSGRATVTADRVDLAIQDLRVSKITGAIDFIELSPLLMPPRQRFTGTLAFSDIGPLPFRAEFQLNEDGNIAVQDLDIDVAGGRMRTRGIIAVQETGLSAKGSVEATSVELREVLRILGIDGLDGQGRVSGTFPIALRNNSARIAGGRLTADGGGALNYRGGTLERQLSGTPDEKAAILRTLADFQYDSLSLELNKATTGVGTVLMRLNGRNPAVYEGNTLAFDVRIASDLRKLERLALGGIHTMADVSRQADRPSRKR
jgi:hypothetical protein